MAHESRIFIGNLASERTNADELHQIFSKYGRITEKITMHRSFGFVQYDNPQSAAMAIANENGRLVGGLRLDIGLANRSKRDDNRNDKTYRRRSASPPRDRSKSPPRSSSSSPLDVKGQVLHIGPEQKSYAEQLQKEVQSKIGLTFDIVYMDKMSISKALEKARRRGYRYVLLAGRENERKRTVNLNILKDTGKSDRLIADVTMEECLAALKDSLGMNQRSTAAPAAAGGPASGFSSESYAAPQGGFPASSQQQSYTSLAASLLNPNSAGLLAGLAGQLQNMDPQQQANFAALLPLLASAMSAQQMAPQPQLTPQYTPMPVYANPYTTGVAPLPQVPPQLLQQPQAYAPVQLQAAPSAYVPQQVATAPSYQPASSSAYALSALLGAAQNLLQSSSAPADTNQNQQPGAQPPPVSFPKIGFSPRK